MPLLAPVLLRLRSPQAAPAVLLVALAGGLGGLALPGGASGLALASSPAARAQVSQVALPWTEHASALNLTAPAAAPITAVAAHRATRSRPLRPLWVRPVAAPVNSPYGMRWGRMHQGVDFAAPYGAPIHVVGDGVVVGVGYLADEGGYGQLILVQHAPGVMTAYAHTSRVMVHAGERVRAGQVIGLVGATGHVTGPHLHFEVRLDGVKVDPRPWLRRHGIVV